MSKSALEYYSVDQKSRNLSHGNLQTLEATISSNLLLQLDHTLLVTARVNRVSLQRPAEVLIGVVRHEVGVEDAQTLAVVGNLLPVTVHVLDILAEEGVGALEDLAVDGGAHDGLHVDVFLVRLRGSRDHVVGGALDGTQELAHLLRVGSQEGVVGDVQDAAEAAAAQFGELVDAEHLHVVVGTVLGGQPVGQLDHLHVLETDSGVDFAADDGLGDVHAAADGGVVVSGHSVVLGELVDLDLRTALGPAK